MAVTLSQHAVAILGYMPYTDFNWIDERLAVGAFVGEPHQDLPFDAILSLETHAPATLRELIRSGRVDYQWRSIIDGISDESNDEIVARFDAAAAQVNDWRSQSRRVLVHCYAGVSRAVTATTWYLVRYQGLSWDEALARISAQRPIANPNIRFEIPLRLASGEELSDEWINGRIAEYAARIKAEYDVDVDPEEIWQTLERQGTIKLRRTAS